MKDKLVFSMEEIEITLQILQTMLKTLPIMLMLLDKLLIKYVVKLID